MSHHATHMVPHYLQPKCDLATKESQRVPGWVFSMNFMVRIFGEKRCRPVYPAFQNRPQLINFSLKNRSFLRLRGSNRSSAGENGLAR